MAQIDLFTLTLVLCTQRKNFYIPPELLRLILLLVGIVRPISAEDLAWIPKEFRQERDVYRFDCPQYLSSNLDPYMCVLYDAANCLQLYIDRGLPRDKEICVYAARDGQIKCLRLLVANGFYKHENACAYAAGGGHYACLELLIANGFPKNEFACALAANNGEYACLQLLIANNFPKSKWACEWAADVKQTRCLQLLIDNGFPH